MELAVGHVKFRLLPWAVLEAQILHTWRQAPNKIAVSLTLDSVDTNAHARIGDPVARFVVADP